MDFVLLRHPDHGGEYLAPESSVGHWLGLGWQKADENLLARPKEELEALAKERGVAVAANANKTTIVEAIQSKSAK